MDEYLRNLDFQILIWIPLALITAKEVKTDFKQIFDKDLTVKDRNALQKINIFFIIPLVVLLHEVGHALATIAFGGTVKELHFGIWWGFVIPVGEFTQAQDLMIYLAGSAVQIAAGLLALICALFVSSPPIVALLVYSGLFAIGGTIVIYALMSMAGMYGDWIAIYSSPLRSWVHVIGVCHALMVAGLLYIMYGARPRLWYTCKTRPKWCKDFKAASKRVQEDPSAVNFLNLAWSYYFVGMSKEALATLARAEELDPDLISTRFLKGCVERSGGDMDGAIRIFEELLEDERSDDLIKARALMVIGHCLCDRADYEANTNHLGGQERSELYGSVMESYEQAARLQPQLADPLFYKAVALNKAELHNEAENQLKQVKGHEWLDPSLEKLVALEFKVARHSKSEEE